MVVYFFFIRDTVFSFSFYLLNGWEKLFFFPDLKLLMKWCPRYSCCFSLLNMQSRDFRLTGLSVMSLRESYITEGFFLYTFSQERKNRAFSLRMNFTKEIWPQMYWTGVSSSFSILSSWFEDLNLLRVWFHTAFLLYTHLLYLLVAAKRGTPFSCSLSFTHFFRCVSCSRSNGHEASGCVGSFLKSKRKWTLV